MTETHIFEQSSIESDGVGAVQTPHGDSQIHQESTSLIGVNSGTNTLWGEENTLPLPLPPPPLPLTPPLYIFVSRTFTAMMVSVLLCLI